MTEEQRARKNLADRNRRARLRAAKDPEFLRKERERKSKAGMSDGAYHAHLGRKRDHERMTRVVKGWTLPEDGIFDEVAVEIAVAGRRRVRLTRRERDAAVRILSEWGFTCRAIAERLYIDKDTAAKVLRQEAA